MDYGDPSLPVPYGEPLLTRICTHCGSFLDADPSSSSIPVKASVVRNSGAKKSKMPPIFKSYSPTTSPVTVDDNGNELPKVSRDRHLYSV